ncbi:DUF1613-domain-containing protein [Lentinus tigrinus ALCF2SS1-6]|uniref:tRNA (uracil-O(2)-)-methyltransferase n=1 Tax=Lentinus tigrinus ALCF2SS1-6 TaxID=1328759 RepID=A0A5C2SM61_9APHY|nr:DUF1613-domain-containing protein [Lentinus tigrinus ALCF2SS1-6]
MSSLRPRFCPSPCTAGECPDRLIPQSDTELWIPIIQCSADFPPEIFDAAVSQLIHHPEYNSTLILRSETVSDTSSDFPPVIPRLDGFRPVRSIHRKLLPRRPGRDAGLEQHCTLYASASGDDDCPTTLVLTPILEPGASLPYYHPAVQHLAFRYIPADTPLLRIEIEPLPGTSTDLNSRIYRTCLALLDTLHRYGWGTLTNYKKRVHHDCIIPREEYQDLYLVMRERHKHLVNEWQEVTDPLKHVFEDIGIATFLMLLWKNTYRLSGSADSPSDLMPLEDAPWKTWPRPSAGFLDLGCGNGLLTHILTAEGYVGHGIDVRARTSWSHYPESTQAQLHVESLDPTSREEHPYLRPGVFIIANHADELTPWTPVLATLYGASGYLSIPCCAWAFDAKYERASTADYPMPGENFVDGLNLGGDGSNTSSYSRYRIWLASLSLYCGWRVECETLRIPSTRNWAIIGRSRSPDSTNELEEVRRRVEEIVEHVRERGMFKTRVPEGKSKDH